MEIKTILEQEFTDSTLEVKEDSFPQTLIVPVGRLFEICQFLHTDPRCYFDLLSSITGIDNGPDAGTMDVIYHLYSIPTNVQLGLQVSLPREQAVVPTISSIWRTANWHEREVYDLLGIQFEGHPDLRRILLPNDWEGHPLRKDYDEQQYYHGVKVKY